MTAPNQPPLLADYNLFTCDPALGEALRRECPEWPEDRVCELGRVTGSQEVIRWGFQANECPPVLKTHDRFGNRIDEVEFHPAWHNLMQLSRSYGLHNSPWVEPRPGAHAARAALMFLASQNEAGHTCPVSMTYSSVPALRKAPRLAALWEQRINANGALIGMAMTEKQGGSDVRANSTIAAPLPGSGDEFRIDGHKWFCSAPMSDAFLILAQAPGGLACFLLPRRTPDGGRNGFHLQRLKSKLGNRSNASSEVEFVNAWATRIGGEGRGVPTVIDMVQHTRLDCVIGSTALMRQSLTQAIHHARHRSAFGRALIEQPLMQNVLADLALEAEAALVLMMRLARAFDGEPGLARLATAIAKYWICKRATGAVHEALECLGGNGYIEECVMPRLLREAPLNSIWEGSGNVICLDILRALAKEPAAITSVMDEIQIARGSNRHFDAYVDQLNIRAASEVNARHLAEHLALALQAGLLLRHSPSYVADAFCATRLAGDSGRSFGTLSARFEFKKLIERAFPG